MVLDICIDPTLKKVLTSDPFTEIISTPQKIPKFRKHSKVVLSSIYLFNFLYIKVKREKQFLYIFYTLMLCHLPVQNRTSSTEHDAIVTNKKYTLEK